jgi:uncharacterized protein YjbJ (UPF0337 family)
LALRARIVLACAAGEAKQAVMAKLGRHRRPSANGRCADIGLRERGRIVRAVAAHGDELALRLLVTDELQLVLRRRLGEEVVHAGFRRDGGSRYRIVAGDHDGGSAKTREAAAVATSMARALPLPRSFGPLPPSSYPTAFTICQTAKNATAKAARTISTGGLSCHLRLFGGRRTRSISRLFGVSTTRPSLPRLQRPSGSRSPQAEEGEYCEDNNYGSNEPNDVVHCSLPGSAVRGEKRTRVSVRSCRGLASGTGAARPPLIADPISREVKMNWDRIEGNWKQFKGNVKEQWGKLTDSDFDVINGRRDVLAGRIQERYGIARDEAERQINDWLTRDDWDRRPL